jgi:hypothetical protein
MPQIALRPFMAAVMRAAGLSVKRFRERHDPAATMPGIVPKAPDFSPVGSRILTRLGNP